MFTQRCFIRSNSWQIINTLMKFGKNVLNKEPNGYIVSNEELVYSVCDEEEYLENMILNGFIDCGTNEELFLAISALRNDSDRFQWFIMDADIYTEISKGDWFVATDIKGGKHVGTQIDPLYCHKATVEELINKFSV